MVDVKRIWFSLFITIFILIFSVFVWSNSNMEEGYTIASSYSDINISVYFDGIHNLYIMSDNNSNNLDSSDLILRNPSNKDKNYYLVYAYNKSSSVPYESIRIMLNNTIYKLGDTKYSEDDTYYYFYLDSNNLSSYSNLEYEVKFWINNNYDVKITDVLSGKFMTFEIEK